MSRIDCFCLLHTASNDDDKLQALLSDVPSGAATVRLHERPIPCSYGTLHTSARDAEGARDPS